MALFLLVTRSGLTVGTQKIFSLLALTQVLRAKCVRDPPK
jgi:hypothetical protein